MSTFVSSVNIGTVGASLRTQYMPCPAATLGSDALSSASTTKPPPPSDEMVTGSLVPVLIVMPEAVSIAMAAPALMVTLLDVASMLTALLDMSIVVPVTAIPSPEYPMLTGDAPDQFHRDPL
jgi:hypothetical protein